MRRIISQVFCLAVVILTAPAHGQIAGPRLGYVWDTNARALLPVDGVPGASILGRAVDMGMYIERAAVSQRAGSVLAIAGSDGGVYLFRTAAGPSGPQSIEGATAHVDRIALSPSGSAAALYSTSDNVLQVITGVPQQPTLAHSIAMIGLDRMAISDDGSVMILAATDGSASLLATDSGKWSPIPLSDPVCAMAFRPLSHDVLIASGGLINFVSAIDNHPAYQARSELPGDPVALAFSLDGRRFVAAYADGRVQMSDLLLGASPLVRCLCHPTGLEPLDGDAVFALRADRLQPLFLFEGTKNRVSFVGRDEQ
jgi:WD40 repeat protein